MKTLIFLLAFIAALVVSAVLLLEPTIFILPAIMIGVVDTKTGRAFDFGPNDPKSKELLNLFKGKKPTGRSRLYEINYLPRLRVIISAKLVD